TVKISRELSIRRSDHDPACVYELAGPRVPLVMESGSFRQQPDRSRIAGEKMPALFGSVALVPAQVRLLFFAREVRSLFRIKAHRDHFKILARIKRLQHVETACQPVEDLIAKHRTRI